MWEMHGCQTSASCPRSRMHPRIHGCLRARLCGMQSPRGPWAVTGVWGHAVYSGYLWKGEGMVHFTVLLHLCTCSVFYNEHVLLI